MRAQDSGKARRPKRRLPRADVERFYMALARLLRTYQFRDRDRQTICGITITQCYALEFLVHGKRLTVLQLAGKLALNKANASRAVAALEAMGAVTRTRDPGNHRVHWITATARGRRLHEGITRGLKQGYERQLRPYGPTFIRRVTGFLEDLASQAARRSGS